MNSTYCLPVFQVASLSCRETHTTTYRPMSEEPSNEETLVSWWLTVQTTTLRPQRLQKQVLRPTGAGQH